MGSGYQDYSVCDGETRPPHDLCKVRVALDRIFWKGDYLEYVAVNGKSLKSMLEESENEMAQQSQLSDTGHLAGVAHLLRHCSVRPRQHH